MALASNKLNASTLQGSSIDSLWSAGKSSPLTPKGGSFSSGSASPLSSSGHLPGSSIDSLWSAGKSSPLSGGHLPGSSIDSLWSAGKSSPLTPKGGLNSASLQRSGGLGSASLQGGGGLSSSGGGGGLSSSGGGGGLGASAKVGGTAKRAKAQAARVPIVFKHVNCGSGLVGSMIADVTWEWDDWGRQLPVKKNAWSAEVNGRSCEPEFDENELRGRGLMFGSGSEQIVVAERDDYWRRKSDTSSPYFKYHSLDNEIRFDEPNPFGKILSRTTMRLPVSDGESSDFKADPDKKGATVYLSRAKLVPN